MQNHQELYSDPRTHTSRGKSVL